MKATVIMRSKNAAWVIGQALAGLHAQRFTDFELIVVDSGSTDGTIELIEQFPATLVHIPASSYVPGRVLNDAAARARGELLIFQNSDVVPLSPDTLDHLLAPFADPAVVASFARQLPRPEAHTWVRRDYAAAFPARGPAPAWMPYSLPLAAMRKDAWARRPFADDAWASEDTTWGLAARRAGETIAYAPEALVMHSHNYTLKEIYGRRFVEGEADAFLHDQPWRAVDAGAAWARSLGNDVTAHARAGDLLGLLAAPVRRAAFHLGYVRGRRLGDRRRAVGDRDVGAGQRVVLERFGGAAANEGARAR